MIREEGSTEDSRAPAASVSRFFDGTAFPAFALSLLLVYEALLVTALVFPAAETGLGAFAAEFRVWCFGYDPATGRLDWGFAMGMLAPPLMLAAILVLVWWDSILELLEAPERLLRPAVAALGLTVAGVMGFILLGSSPETGELPFPAEALRTVQRPPELALTNQRGEPVDLAELRGEVVMLTAVYASCVHTCPLILTQAKESIGGLTPRERADLRVVAVTMDPSHDTPEVLADLASRHGLDAPLYNLVTGEPATVERILDELDIARERDPETGIISHANLFVLMDRAGRIAYRFTLGERQQRWLTSALRLLLREQPENLEDGPADG